MNTAMIELNLARRDPIAWIKIAPESIDLDRRAVFLFTARRWNPGIEIAGVRITYWWQLSKEPASSVRSELATCEFRRARIEGIRSLSPAQIVGVATIRSYRNQAEVRSWVEGGLGVAQLELCASVCALWSDGGTTRSEAARSSLRLCLK
jgi:hypothetical protein